MSQTMVATPAPKRKVLNVSLWIAQLLLFVLFGMAGAMKTFLPPAALVAQGINYATDLPLWLLRFIGVCELLGAVGVLLPALTRIVPSLSWCAAIGFLAIQTLAVAFHAMRGELGMALPLNIVLSGLAFFVLWGRKTKAPIQARK